MDHYKKLQDKKSQQTNVVKSEHVTLVVGNLFKDLQNSNSIANTPELLQSCTKPSIYLYLLSYLNTGMVQDIAIFHLERQ